MDFEPRIRHDIFQASTTYQNDYRVFPKTRRERHNWPKNRTESPEKPSAKHIAIDEETYVPLREGAKIPFNLLWDRKPIIQTNPMERFTMPEKPVDMGKEEAIKTRPRNFTSPGVSLDDVPDPKMRQFLIEALYTTDWEKAAKEAAMPVTECEAPDTTVEWSNKPVSLEVEIYPPLPPGWVEKAKPWDYVQTRACVDPTKTFWLDYGERVKCGACTNPYKGLVPQEIKDQIADLVEKERLRMPHDRLTPAYTGYRPQLTRGVALERTDFSVQHPYLSVAQATTVRYDEDRQYEKELDKIRAEKKRTVKTLIKR